MEKQTLRNPKMTGMAWLTPAITVRDVDKEITFCERAFGLEKGIVLPDKTGKTVHGELKYEGSTVVMFGREGEMGNPSKSPASSNTECPVSLYIYCQNVDELFQRAKTGGATIISEPNDAFWGDRIAEFKDPEGYRWTFATNIADFDPSRMPE